MATVQQTHAHSQPNEATQHESLILDWESVKQLYWLELGKICDWYFPAMAKASRQSLKTIYNLAKKYGVGDDAVAKFDSTDSPSPEYAGFRHDTTSSADELPELDEVEQEYLSKPRW